LKFLQNSAIKQNLNNLSKYISKKEFIH